MIDLNNNWKTSLNVSARFWAWSIIYMFIPLSIIILLYIELPYPNWLLFIIINAVSFIIYKPVLKKVFFKKYRKFDITPNFKNITWKFSSFLFLKILLISNLTTFLIYLLHYSYIYDINSSAMAAFGLLVGSAESQKFHTECINCLVLAYTANIIITILIIKSTIEKYSIISYKQVNSMTWKQSIYCTARHFAWTQVFTLLILLPITCLFYLFGLLYHFIPFLVMIYITISFFASKMSLRKVFFKKYKRFEFYPAIKEISWKMSMQIELLTFLICWIMLIVSFVILFNLLANKTNFTTVFSTISVMLLFFVFTKIAIIKRYVECNATMLDKCEN